MSAPARMVTRREIEKMRSQLDGYVYQADTIPTVTMQVRPLDDVASTLLRAVELLTRMHEAGDDCERSKEACEALAFLAEFEK